MTNLNYSNIATVYITINPINDPPIANNDYYNTNEDTTLNIPAPGILTNDIDFDNNPLTAEKITDPIHGTITFYITGSFVYIPYANYNGIDSFTYRAYDGLIYSNIATVNITYKPNKRPTNSKQRLLQHKRRHNTKHTSTRNTNKRYRHQIETHSQQQKQPTQHTEQ